MYYVRKANKYGAQKKEYNGRLYDSKHEAGIASELELLKRAGEVTKIEPQQTFNLYGKNGGKICTHRPDFLVTFKDGHKEIWEAKGFATQEWKFKLKLFEDNYPELIYYVITPRERFYGSKKRPTPGNHTGMSRPRAA
jgi:hypothetical protein